MFPESLFEFRRGVKMGGVGIGVEEEKVATGFPRGFMGVLEGGKVRESVMRILKFWDK